MRLPNLVTFPIGALLVASLSGCVTDELAPPQPSATFVAPYASDEEALAAAEEAYAEYIRVLASLHQEGLGDATAISTIAAGEHLAELVDERERLQSSGQYILGTQSFDQVVLQRYSVDGSTKEMLAVYLCDDLSALEIFIGDEKVGPSKPIDPAIMQIVFDYDASSSSLLVSSREVWSDEPC